MFVRSVSSFALAVAMVSPAIAAEADLADADGAALSVAAEIVVVGQRGEYGVASTRTGTKTDTPVKDIPQSMTVVSESQIEDQALRSVADILTFVPGATPGTGEGNRDQFTIRGNNTTADFFVDGIRDDVQYSRDLYNADRVEILRGPNAMIFGRGGGGGIINRVTKRSSLNPYREFALQGDSEGGVRLTADIDQPLGYSAGVRLNGIYENGESFRQHVDLERYGINPAAGLLVGPATRMDLSYEYFHDRRTTDRGIPAYFDRPLEGYDRIFFGDPDKSWADIDAHILTFGVEHELSPGLSLRNRTLYGDYDKFYQNVFPSDLIEATSQVRIAAYNASTRRKNLFSQTDLVRKGPLAGIDQTLLVGFELGRQDSRNLRQSGTFASSNLVPLSNPTVNANISFAPSASDANNETEAGIMAVYVQDQIRLSPMFEIVAGLRFDRFTLDVDDLRTAGGTFNRTDKLFSPRLGLIVKPVPDLSLYGSYSRSYLPSSGEQFSGLDPVSELLKPERFDNYELGAKWEAIPGLLATAAVYQLDRTNTRALDAQDRLVLTGAQRSRGVELGLERSISDKWQISAGYAYQESEITRNTTAAPAGREVPLVPRHQFSLWNRYDLNRSVGLGLGVIAASGSYASLSNQVRLPSYARVDAALFYKLASGIEAQVNVENIFDADYYPTAHNDNNIAPGAPTTARATVRFRF